MGVCYRLINATKREAIHFMHVSASKAREIAGNPAAAAITSWYMLQNRGDDIAFVSDSDGEWPFEHIDESEEGSFDEVTGRVVDELIEAGILEDRGRTYEDPDEPDAVYERDLRSVWMEDPPSTAP